MTGHQCVERIRAKVKSAPMTVGAETANISSTSMTTSSPAGKVSSEADADSLELGAKNSHCADAERRCVDMNQYGFIRREGVPQMCGVPDRMLVVPCCEEGGQGSCNRAVIASTDIPASVRLGPYTGGLQFATRTSDHLATPKAVVKVGWTGSKVLAVYDEDGPGSGSHGSSDCWPQLRQCRHLDQRQPHSASSKGPGCARYGSSSMDDSCSSLWMTALQPARDRHEQNVEVVAEEGQLALYVVKQVRQGQRLLLWYADSLACLVGVPILTPANFRGNKQYTYTCASCNSVFQYPNTLKAHILFRCQAHTGSATLGSPSAFTTSAISSLSIFPPSPNSAFHRPQVDGPNQRQRGSDRAKTRLGSVSGPSLSHYQPARSSFALRKRNSLRSPEGPRTSFSRSLCSSAFHAVWKRLPRTQELAGESSPRKVQHNLRNWLIDSHDRQREESVVPDKRAMTPDSSTRDDQDISADDASVTASASSSALNLSLRKPAGFNGEESEGANNDDAVSAGCEVEVGGVLPLPVHCHAASEERRRTSTFSFSSSPCSSDLRPQPNSGCSLSAYGGPIQIFNHIHQPTVPFPVTLDQMMTLRTVYPWLAVLPVAGPTSPAARLFCPTLPIAAARGPAAVVHPRHPPHHLNLHPLHNLNLLHQQQEQQHKGFLSPPHLVIPSQHRAGTQPLLMTTRSPSAVTLGQSARRESGSLDGGLLMPVPAAARRLADGPSPSANRRPGGSLQPPSSPLSCGVPALPQSSSPLTSYPALPHSSSPLTSYPALPHSGSPLSSCPRGTASGSSPCSGSFRHAGFPLPLLPVPSEKDGEPLDLLPPSYIASKTQKGHLCLYCGKLYSRKYGLKIHLRTHTGYKPLKCKVCHRPFGDPSNLNKHVRLHAEGNTPYRCDHCGKVLVRRRDLERHIRSRHPSESSTDPVVEEDDEEDNDVSIDSDVDVTSDSGSVVEMMGVREQEIEVT